MHKDGMIAADIMNRLTDKGIPVLTVHDSFIVQRHLVFRSNVTSDSGRT